MFCRRLESELQPVATFARFIYLYLILERAYRADGTFGRIPGEYTRSGPPVEGFSTSPPPGARANLKRLRYASHQTN